MKKSIVLSAAMLAGVVSQAQVVFGPTGSTINSNFSVKVVPPNILLNANGWKGAMLIEKNPRDPNPNAGAIWWSPAGITDPQGNTAPSYMFLGGPSWSPLGDYWMGLQSAAPSTSAANTYVFQVYGDSRANEPKLGSMSYYNDLLVRATDANGAQNHLGVGTLLPTAQMHTTSTVRFEGVAAQAQSTDTRFLTIDNIGNVGWNTAGPGGVTLNCANTNFVPKVTSPGVLDCSLIYDDGTTVSINSTSPNIFVPGGAYASTTGTGIYSGPTPATLDVNGLTFTTALVVSSDKRLKTDIKPMNNSLSIVKQLNGVRYVWNREKYPNRNFDNFHHAGFLAQDLEKVFPEAVVINQHGEYAVNYNTFAPLLAEGIKELSTTVDEQKATIDQLTKRLADMEARLQSMEKGYGAAPADFEGYYLSQNAPNPYDQQTTIQYAIPGTFNEAAIRVYDANGTVVMTKALGSSARGSITLGRDELRTGTYIYTLLVDGKEYVKKKMMVK